MKTASATNDMQTRLDGRGDIDVDYYLHRAKVMRAAYLAAAYVDAKQGIKRRIIGFYQKFICLKCQPSH